MTTPATDRIAFADPTPTHLAALHRALVESAERDDAIDVAYRTVDTSIGRLLVAATRRGLVRVAFELEGFDTVLEQLATRLSPRILAAPGRLDDTAREIDEYFDGRRTRFDLPLDRALSTGFRRTVQGLLPDIAYGRTASYGELAALAGNPKAVRAVGTACATNPLPVVVPCHRVLRADGSLGGYAGGPEVKAALLALERSVA